MVTDELGIVGLENTVAHAWYSKPARANTTSYLWRKPTARMSLNRLRQTSGLAEIWTPLAHNDTSDFELSTASRYWSSYQTSLRSVTIATATDNIVVQATSRQDIWRHGHSYTYRNCKTRNYVEPFRTTWMWQKHVPNNPNYRNLHRKNR